VPLVSFLEFMVQVQISGSNLGIIVKLPIFVEIANCMAFWSLLLNQKY